MGLVILKKTLQRAPFPFLPCEDAAWRKIPNEQGPHQTVDSDGALDLAASRNVRKTFQLFTTAPRLHQSMVLLEQPKRTKIVCQYRAEPIFGQVCLVPNLTVFNYCATTFPLLSLLQRPGFSLGSALLLPLPKKQSEWQNHFEHFLEGPGVNLTGGEIPIRILRLSIQQWHQGGKNAMLIRQLLKLMIKTWGCLSKRIPGISGILHFALEPGRSTSKKFTFLCWRNDVGSKDCFIHCLLGYWWQSFGDIWGKFGLGF